jgi:site-specific recombinase XerD
LGRAPAYDRHSVSRPFAREAEGLRAPVHSCQCNALSRASPAYKRFQSGPEGLKGARDRALLLLGFAGAFRRSELVALDVADLEETEDGFKIIIRRSKTDQEGHGVTIAIARSAKAATDADMM